MTPRDEDLMRRPTFAACVALFVVLTVVCGVVLRALYEVMRVAVLGLH